MRLRHIEIFHAIYTSGSITNAAKVLNVSQPAVSKVLTHAELQLGFKLFDRIKGRLVPTREANMLFGEVDKIYQQIRSIENTTQNIKRSEFGNIVLGITPALGFDIIPNVIASYHADYPNVAFNILTVHNEAAMQSLLEHKCDLTVLFSPYAMPGTVSTALAESELVVVYPKKMFPNCPTKLSLNDIAHLDLIDITDSGPLGDIFWARMLKEKVAFTSIIKVHTYFIAVRLVTRGVGVCIVDRYTAQGNLCSDIAIASFEPSLKFNISTVHLENQTKSKVINQFLPYLKDGVSSKSLNS